MGDRRGGQPPRGAAFALLITKTPALAPGIVSEFAGLGDEAAARSFAKVLWSGILAGWMLALVAWLVEAGDNAIDHFFVVWLLTLLVGLASFDHSGCHRGRRDGSALRRAGRAR
jgi:formate-nitrite transporter family protein